MWGIWTCFEKNPRKWAHSFPFQPMFLSYSLRCYNHLVTNFINLNRIYNIHLRISSDKSKIFKMPSFKNKNFRTCRTLYIKTVTNILKFLDICLHISIVFNVLKHWPMFPLGINIIQLRKSKFMNNSTTSQEFYELFQWSFFVVGNTLYLTLFKLSKFLCF